MTMERRISTLAATIVAVTAAALTVPAAASATVTCNGQAATCEQTVS